MADVIIVGSGASAMAAAWELRNRKVLILDTGLTPPETPSLQKNLFDLRQGDPEQAEYLLGSDFQSLVNIQRSDLVSVKLKAPLIDFVIRGLPELAPLDAHEFVPFISYARGGLANAWGAGAYRYTDGDLEGFPINAGDLWPYYDELTTHMGISGVNDDLEPFFGHINGLQPPLPFNRNCGRFYRCWRRKKQQMARHGIHVGRTQLTVLTRELDGRPAYSGDNTSFFTTVNPSIYTPRITLDRLRQYPNIQYLPGWLVERFSAPGSHVEVHARALEGNGLRTFRGRHLLLAAGAINSGRIVLRSFDDTRTRLPILDNPVSFIPFVDLTAIGAATDMTGYEGGQLILIYEGPRFPGRVQGSIYSIISPLRSDLFFNFPFSLRGNLALTRHIIPAMTVLQLFYPDSPREGNYLRLGKGNLLEIHYQDQPKLGAVERLLIHKFFPWGFTALPPLVQFPKPGNSIHYAGTVPMERRDLKYHSDRECRLNGAPRVHLIDGSVFPHLPAKNLTFTLMANAMRVAHGLKL